MGNLSRTMVSPKKETYFQGQRIISIPGRTITFLDPVKWNEKIQQTLPGKLLSLPVLLCLHN